MTTRVAVIDYGMGNVGSVLNALAFLNVPALLTRNSKEILAASHVILPGVGSFGEGMGNLSMFGLIPALREFKDSGKPFLGICLGMQLLSSVGEEGGLHNGLGWIPGTTRRLRVPQSLHVPHIGWDDVSPRKGASLFAGISPLVFYFVHSFVVETEDTHAVSVFCEYGERFAAALEAGNIFGVQFHPEKSQKSGLALLRNFINHAQN